METWKEYVAVDGMPHRRVTVVDDEGVQHGSRLFELAEACWEGPATSSDLWLFKRHIGECTCPRGWVAIKHQTRRTKSLRGRMLMPAQARAWFDEENILPEGFVIYL